MMKASSGGRTICVCHDIERGFGHRDSDPAFADLADRLSPGHLEEMLAIEDELGVRATYHVLGCLIPDLGDRIARRGHAVGFHSFDHRMVLPQLARCRRVSAEIRGYRPPQSRLTPELEDGTLAALGFEWLASSEGSLGAPRPFLGNGIVRVPIHFDDYALYARERPYDEWEAVAIRMICAREFVCFSLHDCYGQHWLPHYRRFLARLTRLGDLQTLDEVCAAVRQGRGPGGPGTRG